MIRQWPMVKRRKRKGNDVRSMHFTLTPHHSAHFLFCSALHCSLNVCSVNVNQSQYLIDRHYSSIHHIQMSITWITVPKHDEKLIRFPLLRQNITMIRRPIPLLFPSLFNLFPATSATTFNHVSTTNPHHHPPPSPTLPSVPSWFQKCVSGAINHLWRFLRLNEGNQRKKRKKRKKMTEKEWKKKETTE